MNNVDWNEQAKRLLKLELIKRGVSNEELAFLSQELRGKDTKASIDSYISRGTFSAAFLLQYLNALDSNGFDQSVKQYSVIEESKAKYYRIKSLEQVRQ